MRIGHVDETLARVAGALPIAANAVEGVEIARLSQSTPGIPERLFGLARFLSEGLIHCGALIPVSSGWRTPQAACIRAVRRFIEEGGYDHSYDDIRRCRQELMNFADGTPQKNVSTLPDFYTTSNCRDMLFHTQECQFTVPQIEAFLLENNLTFIGFFTHADQDYRKRFPDDKALTDLDHWHEFETENPTTFVGMYKICVQNLAPASLDLPRLK